MFVPCTSDTSATHLTSVQKKNNSKCTDGVKTLNFHVTYLWLMPETSFFHLSLWSIFCLFLNWNSWERTFNVFSQFPLAPSFGSTSSSLSPPLPAVFLNICICVSAAGPVDRLGRCGGGHSKLVYSMSIGARLSFKTPRLSERKFHQPSLGREKTSASHANVLRSGSPQHSCGFCAQTQWMAMSQSVHCARVFPQN